MKNLFSVLFAAVLFTVMVNNSRSQNVNVGPVNPQTYLTLQAAFTAINGGVHGAGAIAVSIVGNTTELASASLNGGVFASCSITPSGARTVTGNLNAAVILLNGADNVTIDGLNTGGNSLSVVNPNTGTNANGVECANAANNNIIRNISCVGLGANGGTAGGRGVNIGQSVSGTGGNNDNLIQNVNTNGFRRGIQFFGTAGLYINERTTVRGCTIRNFTSLGIFCGSETRDNIIENNTIFFDASVPNDAAGSRCINVQGCGTEIVRNNITRDITGTVAGGFIGIITIPALFTAPILTPPTKVEVYNNMIALNNTIATAPFVYGIYTTSNPNTTNYTVNCYFNSIRIGGSSGTTAGAESIGLVEGLDGLHGIDSARIYNNICTNFRLNGDINSLHLGAAILPATNVRIQADNNLYWSNDTTARGWDLQYKTTIYRGFGGMILYKDTVCPLGIEVESAFDVPTFVSATDLHLAAGTVGANMNAKDTIPKTVTTDIDGQSRALSASNPFTYRGADEVLGGKKSYDFFWWDKHRVTCTPSLKYVIFWIRNPSAPYAIKYGVVTKLVCLSPTQKYLNKINLGNGAGNGSYYAEINTDNNIRTQSANPISFANTLGTYDFTTSLSQAYGSNMEAPGPPFGIWGGDVNQDDIVDALDASEVDNAVIVFASGCSLNTDCNGDQFVDAGDVAIVDNNAFSFISAVLLPGTVPRSGIQNNDYQNASETNARSINILKRLNLDNGD